MNGFEDHLPVMAERLGSDGLMKEMCKGFRALADPKTGLITKESLRRANNYNSLLLGSDEIEEMIKEGDLDGDGALNEFEFCVLMIRTSPCFMKNAEQWLTWALSQQEDRPADDNVQN